MKLDQGFKACLHVDSVRTAILDNQAGSLRGDDGEVYVHACSCYHLGPQADHTVKRGQIFRFVSQSDLEITLSTVSINLFPKCPNSERLGHTLLDS